MSTEVPNVEKMKKMTRMKSKKSHSWWWDSHISPKNSKWLAENLEEMDRCVSEMLKLIEEEGDSFAKKAEMYYKRRPQLISHVEDFYRMYRGLAERYDNVTGELRRSIPSKLHPQGSGSGSDFNSEPSSPSVNSVESTPESKPPRPKRAAGFDFFLGSGPNSDISKRGIERPSSSSSSSESNTESDEEKEVNVDGFSNVDRRIIELENELYDLKEMLRKYEEDFPNGFAKHNEGVDHSECVSRVSDLKKEIASLGEKLHESELEIADLKEKLGNASASMVKADVEIELEKKRISDLAERNSEQANLVLEQKRVIEELKTKISEHDEVIETFKRDFAQEKSHLLDGISLTKEELEKMAHEKSKLEAIILEKDQSIRELEADSARSAEALHLEKSALEAKLAVLLDSQTALESKIASLESEKAELISNGEEHINNLKSEVKDRDGRIQKMDEHLQQLHLEHVKLRVRIEEMNEEAERQKMVILEGNEGKREAIRQLCFSLDHYRVGYLQVLGLLQGNKRLVVGT